MGVAGTTNVTVLPASGTVPNDYVVDIDLVALGAQWLYDPTIGTDLLIDVSFTAPAPTTNLVPFSSCPLPTARGRMVSTAAAGPTGTISTAPATVLVDFAGPGGHAFQTPARVERYGAGCGQGLRSFYQDFQIAETFDLANRTLTLTPDNVATPTGYTVAAGSAPPDLTKVNVTPNSTGDEGLVTHALGFTFAWPGGSTSTIKASTNGFVWLDAAATGSDLSPTVLELLGTNGEPARLAPCWYDFHCGRNTGTHPNSGLHVLTDTSAGPGNAVCYVTWANIGVFNQNAVGGTSVSTMQCVLHEATGVAELRIGQMHVTSAQLAITGFSPGRVAGVTSMHPGPHDLSDELPFTTSPDGAVHALTHNAAARPVLGAPFTLQAYNQPAGTVVGALLAGFTPQVPAIAMAPLAPGCGASLFLPGMATVEAFVAPAGTVTSSPLMIPHPFVGAQLFTQYAALDALGNVYTSNGLRLTAGLN
jgi:hypothetical protein